MWVHREGGGGCRGGFLCKSVLLCRFFRSSVLNRTAHLFSPQASPWTGTEELRVYSLSFPNPFFCSSSVFFLSWVVKYVCTHAQEFVSEDSFLFLRFRRTGYSSSQGVYPFWLGSSVCVCVIQIQILRVGAHNKRNSLLLWQDSFPSRTPRPSTYSSWRG